MAAHRVQPGRRYLTLSGLPVQVVEANGDQIVLQSLASAIDALLLEGGRTMRGIIRELMRKAGAACRGRDVAANVRARLYWFRRKGRAVHRDVSGRIRFFRPLPAQLLG